MKKQRGRENAKGKRSMKAKAPPNGNGNAAPVPRKGKRQLEIPGAEAPADDELDELIAPFVTARYQRQEAQKQEIDLHAKVLEAMRGKRLKAYTYRDGEMAYDLERAEVGEKVRVHRRDGAE